MRFLHTADVHLKEMNDLEIIRVLAGAANASKCDAILICGDLFDKDSSVRSTEPGLADALETFQGQIYILPGNHDAAILAERKSLSSNSTVLNSGEMAMRIKFDAFEIVAVPYKDELCFKDVGEIDCDPASSILMAHGAFYSVKYFYEGARDYFPIFEEDLRDKFRYAALGHYHKPMRMNLGRTLAVNPGSPRTTRDSDTGKRQASILDTNGWKSEALELDVPYFEKVPVDINFSDTPDKISEKTAAALSALPDDRTYLEKLFLEYRGTLSDQIRIDDLKDLAARWIRDFLRTGRSPKKEWKAVIETASIKLIDNEILKNPFIQSLMEEIGRLDSTPEEKEKLRLFSIERIHSLF